MLFDFFRNVNHCIDVFPFEGIEQRESYRVVRVQFLHDRRCDVKLSPAQLLAHDFLVHVPHSLLRVSVRFVAKVHNALAVRSQHFLMVGLLENLFKVRLRENFVKGRFLTFVCLATLHGRLPDQIVDDLVFAQGVLVHPLRHLA